ncbi:MAG: HdeD family acid-resistance protein [Anaerolineales bacterium]|nr:HdeD family acid-resistance protein [Anaerolineales bacterium]
MLQNLSRYWWLVGLRGLFAIIFGVLAFAWPGITLSALVILFGAYAIVDGISNIATGVSHRDTNDRWWVLLLEGVVGIAAGIVAFVYTGITAIVLLYLIAFWAIFTGVMEIVAAIRLRQEIENEWTLGLMGVLSVILGLIMIVSPGAGALALIWLIATYAILFGALLIYLAFKLRQSEPEPAMSPTA